MYPCAQLAGHENTEETTVKIHAFLFRDFSGRHRGT
jgi:hypothetical protein